MPKRTPTLLVADESGWRWPWKSRMVPGSGGVRMRHAGTHGIEFAGHRPYSQGEDARHVDWAIYGRTGRLFTRLRESEGGRRVCLAFDGSSSMEVGDAGDGHTKGSLARELAAALAQSFVLAGETCRVVEFAEGLHRRTRWVNGRTSLPELASLLDAPISPRKTNWTRSMRELQALDPACPTVILSDFWGGEEMGEALRNLQASGRELLGIQILSPAEAAPQPTGPVRLCDAETGETIELDIHPGMVREYQQALRQRTEFLGRLFRQAGGAFLQLTSADSLHAALRKLIACKESLAAR